MAWEIERRFLVTGAAWKASVQPQRLRQGYLKLTPQDDIRVRIIDDAAWLAIKKRHSAVSRWEFEYPIPLADAETLLAQLCISCFSKHRYRVVYRQQVFDIDEYLGDQAPLVLAEIELTSENAAIEPPPWLGTEVTHDACFQLAHLSRHPFSTWCDTAPAPPHAVNHTTATNKDGVMDRNEQLFQEAKRVIPGGVNSPVRAFGSVGGVPRFIRKAKDACVWDEAGNQYIDYVGSWGPAIVGHAHPEVVEAVRAAALGGLSFGAPTEGEVRIAEAIVKLIPSVEQVRLVSSGTEATMSAIRLARGFTGRDNIIKFEGCYHGHSDSLLVKAGSGLLTFGHPSSAGVPEDCTRHTLVLPYNDVDALAQTFAENGAHIACVIVEPIAGNMNMVQATPEFVQALRQLTEQYGAVLIYDEVMTGFRVALGGAQSLHGITPDLTTMGKVIGGGMPMAAFGGRADIMACISPLGAVYQAGTLSGNPLAVAAGLKTLEIIQRPGFYELLNERTQALCQGLQAAAAEQALPFSAQGVGGMFGLYFMPEVPQRFADMQRNNGEHFKQFFHGMLRRGVAFAPSGFEASFMSAAHTPENIADTLGTAAEVFTEMARG